MLKVVEKQDAREAGEELLPLDEIAREGARRMLMEALKAEVDDYVERHRGERDEHGRALVVRNGRGQGRLPWARGRWSSRHRGLMTAAVMNKEVAGASAAGSCHLTCGVRPRWQRCCRSYTCADSPPAIFARAGRVARRGCGRSIADQHHPTYC